MNAPPKDVTKLEREMLAMGVAARNAAAAMREASPEQKKRVDSTQPVFDLGIIEVLAQLASFARTGKSVPPD